MSNVRVEVTQLKANVHKYTLCVVESHILFKEFFLDLQYVLTVPVFILCNMSANLDNCIWTSCLRDIILCTKQTCVGV